MYKSKKKYHTLLDDQHCTIRYLVVDTGNWLPGRQVLISPYALVTVNRKEQHIDIGLTKKQIEDSPSVSSEKPVSRQFEETYYRHYCWPMYWRGQYMWGASFYPFIMSDAGPGPESAQGASLCGLEGAPTAMPDSEASRGIARNDNTWNPYLRSTYDVSGYRIHAEDGEIGHVNDCVINLSRSAIKQAPQYTEESLLTRDYESRLHGHYNRQGYWVDQKVAHE